MELETNFLQVSRQVNSSCCTVVFRSRQVGSYAMGSIFRLGLDPENSERL